jgi:hypothetical protein
MIPPAAIGAGIQLVGSIFAAASAKKKAREAGRQAAALEAKIQTLESQRPAVVNPYAAFEDLSGKMTNTYANLGVATQAADMQIEQADISLANTLDTIRATGASAGGATALAQAALESKKGVTASIEAQEAQNQKLMAQGEEALQAKQVAEQQRLQQAEASGAEFVYREEDARKMQQIQRASGQQDQARSNQMQYNQNAASAISSGLGAIASGITGAAKI